MSTTSSRRRIGDRKEGRRLRTLPALNLFTPYIMIDRNDACNQFAGSIEISETDRWLRAKRQEGCHTLPGFREVWRVYLYRM